MKTKDTSALTQKNIKALLEKEFDIDDPVFNPKDQAFINVTTKDCDGHRYGSYCLIDRTQLEGRKVEYGIYNNSPAITLLDSVFDRKTWTESNPLKQTKWRI